jgi:hypothetical protein
VMRTTLSVKRVVVMGSPDGWGGGPHVVGGATVHAIAWTYLP